MLRAWIKTTNPILLITSLFPYALGTGMADYFGHTPSAWRYFGGQLVVLLLLISGEMLFVYFSMIEQGAEPFGLVERGKGQKQPSPLTLIVVLSILLVAAVIIGLKLGTDVHNPSLIILFLVMMSLMAVLMGGSPKLRYSGYAEIIQSLLLGSVIPAFAFLVQSGGLHPFILPATLPTVLLWLAVCLVFQLASFNEDIQKEKQTLLVRLGWQRSLLFHHVLLLIAYIFIGLMPVFGLAWRLVWPMLIALPAALLEIWLINRVALGWPPRWLLLKTVSVLNFILPVYLLASRFWLV